MNEDDMYEMLKKVLKNPVLFIQNFMEINDKNGKTIKFKLNELQKDFMDNYSRYNVILKSRQLGFSTLADALSIYYAITEPNTTCLLVSYSLDSATGIFEKLKFIYSTIPEELKPQLINNNKKELKFTNGSRIVVATNGNKDIARGLTIKFCHISEMGFMTDTISKNLLAIEQAMTPSSMLVVESTANGMNSFEKLYSDAEKGQSLYRPFFYNWYENKSMFADEYKQFHEVFIKRNGKALTLEDLTEYEKKIHEDGATLEQLEWRRLKIINNKGNQLEKEAQFRQEYPANPMEAFASTSNSIFNKDKIIERTPYLPRPLKENKLPHLNATLMQYVKNNSLKIYKDVKKRENYYAGVDSSEGLGQDYDVIEIMDSNGEQVAEFHNNIIAPYEFTEIIFELLTYYNNAYAVIEKANTGITIIKDLRRQYGYMNMYKHKMFDQKGKKKKELGFVTNGKSKVLIINDFKKAFEEREILINSNDLLEEMHTFVALEGGGYGAIKGKHDDLIMSIMMCYHGVLNGIQYV